MSSIEIVLYQPDIPQNTGTILRMAACFDICVHIIEPAGFVLNDRTLRRAGMDYLSLVSLIKHRSWEVFSKWRQDNQKRLLLLSTKASDTHTGFEFENGDLVMFGRESSGVPDHVHEAVDHRLIVPMRQNARSLNLAMTAAIVSGEALRQLDAFPSIPEPET
ncbi:MAG: tRNA (cytidine(34)-2'-O)-methyltransferase [Cohaesibacteraceae bacterium]|nr:tRNA (cytidine(34)-2'-O)-methyltransferase [Cohaesibacteraceae bacterium]MBL4876136.1 tRNA (cytidine(34)-2'-O)-methyltransferase [Cohaesibacteraceae bacterium]